MNAVAPHAAEKTAIRTQLGAIFVSLELSRSTWLERFGRVGLTPTGKRRLTTAHGESGNHIAARLALSRYRSWILIAGPSCTS